MAFGQELGLILNDIAHFNFDSDQNSNECKFSIKRRDGHNGFTTKWYTTDGNVNENTEVLDGVGHQVDMSPSKQIASNFLYWVLQVSN